MRSEPPPCKTIGPWLRQLLGKGCLAPLTGQDAAALSAFVHAVRLYSYSDEHGQHAALLAMTGCVQAMQPQTRMLAKRSIPHLLDWGDEDRLWSKLEI